MMRAVVTCLLTPGVLPKTPTIPPDWEQEGLPCKTFDNIRDTDGEDRRNSDTRRIPEPDNGAQPRPELSADGNSEGERENASIRPFLNTPRVEATPAYGSTGRNSTPTNICGIASTDSNKETEGPGHTRPYVPHLSNRHIGRHSS